MIGALYTGANGFYSNEIEIDTIANNLANLNSIGFKKSNVNFYDMIYQQVTGNSEDPSQIGIGDKVGSVDTNFSQGELIDSSNPTAAAISGDGLFVLKGQNNSDGTYKTFYSRAGDFSLDADENLVNGNGNIVMGWLAESTKNGYEIPIDSATGLPTGALSPINVSAFHLFPATQTSQIRVAANLNSGDQVIEKSTAAAENDASFLFDENGKRIPVIAGDDIKVSFDGGSSYTTLVYGTDFTTLGDLSDKIGSAYAAATGNPASDVSITDGKIIINNSGKDPVTISVVPGDQPDIKFDTAMEDLSGIAAAGGSVSTQPFYAATHTVHAYFYDSSGNKHPLDIGFRHISDGVWNWKAILGDTSGMLSNNSGSINFNPDGTMVNTTQSPSITYTPSGGASQSITLNLWNTDSGAFETNPTSGVTSFAIDSETGFLYVDGNQAGNLKSVQIGAKGNIDGLYSNGKTVSLAKLAVAKFANNSGLSKVGNSLFAETENSGAPDIGISGQGRGTVLPGKLEGSNVDLSEELAQMLTSQRGFQADSKSITTADSMLQTAIQLKR